MMKFCAVHGRHQLVGGGRGTHAYVVVYVYMDCNGKVSPTCCEWFVPGTLVEGER